MIRTNVTRMMILGLLATTPALAEPPVWEVEVTNLPDVQDVNVVGGAATSCAVKTFELVGFTVATLAMTQTSVIMKVPTSGRAASVNIFA